MTWRESWSWCCPRCTCRRSCRNPFAETTTVRSEPVYAQQQGLFNRVGTFFSGNPNSPHHDAPGRPGYGPSWFRIWAVVVGTAVAVTFIVLAVGLWHGHSGTAPATNGTPTSTSIPAHPTTPVIPPTAPSQPL